jgi:hypothetical protein
MKVRELIEKLQAMPQDHEVWLQSTEGDASNDIDVEVGPDGAHRNAAVWVFTPELDEPDSADPIVRNGR